MLYLQGMGMIAAIFLLLMEEEDAFWMTTAVIEEVHSGLCLNLEK